MQIKLVAIIISLLAISACEDNNIKQCADLQNDENKRPLAFSFCEKAAQQGDATAQLFMAKAKLADEERQQAVDLLEKSANQKNAEATFQLGEIYAEDKNLEKARFYHQRSCDLNFIKGCERISVLDNQVESEKQKLKAEAEAAQEAKALAEQQAKEAERQAKEAEQKALNAEKQRLEQERKQLEEKNRSVNIEALFMTEKEAIDAYSSFLDTFFGKKSMEEWVNNCYARSSNKRGCFHFDLLVNIVDEILAKSNEEKSSFFSNSLIKSRALRYIPELQNITTSQFNQIVLNAIEVLSKNMNTFIKMWEKKEQKYKENVSLNSKNLDFQENLAKFEQNGLWGFVDRQGNIVIRPQFYSAGGFYNGRAVVKNANEKWGYIDKNGNWVISPQYCMAGRFSEGLAGVYVGGYGSGDNCHGGKWGFIDVNGNFVINAVLDEATRFNKGKAKVTYQGQSGYINRNGNWVN